MASSQSGFAARQNGFQFVNRFTLPFDSTIRLPLVGEIDLSKIVFGLCGGMCFASLDYFYAGQPLPDFNQPDGLPPDFLRYLWDRQVDSMGLVVIPRVIEWMLQDDREVALRTARYEIPKMRRQLDRGDPVVLCLVRGKGFTDPTANHQVLATAYDFDEATRLLTISLCDPNHPGLDSSLTLNLTSPGHGLQAAQSTGETLRGMFVIRYFKQDPPDLGPPV